MSTILGKAQLLRCPPGTSLQDEGRVLGSNYGIPKSGAMDLHSYHWANHLLKNERTAVALEMAQPGLKIKFEAPCRVALAGAATSVTVNQVAISNPSLISLDAEDLLEIGAFQVGARLYLCIEGGFQVEKYLGSGSDFALGSLWTTQHQKNGKRRAQLAVEAAVKYSTSCIGPVDVVSI